MSSDQDLPDVFTRLQFLVCLAFAMTANKSQCQSFDKIGLYLPTPFFTHGQLYVALSRVQGGSSSIVVLDRRVKNVDIYNKLKVIHIFFVSRRTSLKERVPTVARKRTCSTRESTNDDDKRVARRIMSYV